MDKHEIKTGNLFIAKYMEADFWQCWTKGGYKPHWADKFSSAKECVDAIQKTYGSIESLKNIYEAVHTSPEYHLSWDMLMPVIAKMNEIDVYSKHFKAQYGDFGADMMDSIATSLTTVDIETTWRRVVEFVKWDSKNEK